MIGPPQAGRSGLTIAIALAMAARIGAGQTADLGSPAPGLEGGGGTSEAAWDAPRSRELAERAIQRRATWTSDPALRDYQAQAQGHIYFLFDLGQNTERHLIKADQLALNLFWVTPGQTRQIIVGHREKRFLPTNIHYHLDHLTVVMDNFGDRISLGEGSEVRDALHPAAPGALDFYQYRIVDSLTLQLPDREVQVHRVEMRPRNPRGPGLVGSIYLDRDSADIVRMDFTFTASSYLDSQLDYINVRLENAMWGGRYWLPYRQGIELRREVEVLKFPAGGIIRAEFDINGYHFNTDVPASFFDGPRVTRAPARARESFEFESGLYDALDPSVATNPPSMEEIRQRARRMVSESYLQPAHNLRLAARGVSSLLRLRRAEGLYAGAGVNRSAAGWDLLIMGGYAIGAERGQAAASLTAPLSPSLKIVGEGYWNRPADVAPWPASSGAIATLGAILEGDDYRDPYWSAGGTLSLTRSVEALRIVATVGWEDWESATLEAEQLFASYRAVRAVDDGEVAFLALRLVKPPEGALDAVGGTNWDVRIEGATDEIAGDFEYLYGAARGEQAWPGVAAGVGLKLSAAGAAVVGGGLPAQRLFPAGGRGTVRGYRFHRFVGNLYGALGAELRRDVWYPFLSLAAFVDVAWLAIEGEGAERAVTVWNKNAPAAGGSDGALVGLGASAGILFDVLLVDLARGLSGDGIWELVIRVRADFWPWL